MLERARGQFRIEGNVEDIFGGISGATRIARISQTYVFTGELEGESIAEYTAVFPREGEGSFQGFQRISGKLGEREGTFVVEVTGAYHRGGARGRWSVVPKSGSGDFLYIRGEGEYELPAGKPATYRLEFDARKPRAARSAVESAESDIAPVPAEIAVYETIVEPAVEIEPLAKPVRRTQSKPAPATERHLEPVEPLARPLRRKKAESGVKTEQLPTNVADPEPAIKPARRQKPKPVPPSDPEQTAEPLAQLAKPARRKKTPAVVAAEPEPTAPAKPQRGRPRKKVETEVIEAPIESPAPVARKSTRRKETDPLKVDTPVPAQPAPSRRKRATAPAEPLPLPIAQAKPPRQRRKAA